MADHAEHFTRLHVEGDIRQGSKFSPLPVLVGTTRLPPEQRSRDTITKCIVSRLQTEGIALGEMID